MVNSAVPRDFREPKTGNARREVANEPFIRGLDDRLRMTRSPALDTTKRREKRMHVVTEPTLHGIPTYSQSIIDRSSPKEIRSHPILRSLSVKCFVVRSPYALSRTHVHSVGCRRTQLSDSRTLASSHTLCCSTQQSTNVDWDRAGVMFHPDRDTRFSQFSAHRSRSPEHSRLFACVFPDRRTV